MRRRAFLAAGLAGLAGCSGLRPTDESRSGTLTPAPVPTASPTPTPGPFDGDGSPTAAAIGASTVAGRTLALHPSSYGGSEAETRLRFVAAATAESPARVRAFLRPRSAPPTTVPFETPPFRSAGRLSAREGPGSTPGAVAATDCYLPPVPGNPVADRVPSVELVDAQGGHDGRDGHGGRFWRLSERPRRWLPREWRITGDGVLVAGFYVVAGPAATGPLAGRYTPVDATPPVSVAAWATEAPGPRAASVFDRSVPPLPGDRATRWFHELGPAAPVFLRPSAERVTAPATVTVTLVDHSTRAVDAEEWSLYRLADGDWYELGPLFRNRPPRVLPPGHRRDWQFTLAHGAADETATGSGPEETRLGFLGGGTYAITAGAAADGARPAALVTLSAPPVTIRPTADAHARRAGDTVVVRGDPPPDEDDDERRVLVLDRLPLGPGTATPTPTDGGHTLGTSGRLPRLLVEQAMRSRGLRNTLGYAGDAEQVRLRTTDDVTRRALRRVDFRTGGRRFRFADDRVRVTVDSRRPVGPTSTAAGD